METVKGKTSEESFGRLSERIDAFEKYSRPHSRFMQDLAIRLARRMGLNEQDERAIGQAALLHDIGMYAMAPAYNSSPGPLTVTEKMDLWRHPIIGEQQLAKREASRHAQLLVRWHHEWWNGTGYPDTLAFEDIPIGARILRAVDLYSSLVSDRPYRAALSDYEAALVLKASAGIECDPYVVKALVALLHEEAVDETNTSEAIEPTNNDGSPLPSINQFLSRRQNYEPEWRGWSGSRYNRKLLLGFEVSVLRQLQFNSIALPYCGWGRLAWYLNGLVKQVFANDPKAWAAVAASAALHSGEPLTAEDAWRLVEDAYVPSTKLNNPELRGWFGEADGWWLDNVRQRIEMLPSREQRLQALLFGMRVGDYALSFTEETSDLKLSLTTVFRQLISRGLDRLSGHSGSTVSNMQAAEFVRSTRADLLYLTLLPSHTEHGGSEARSEWRESWVGRPREITDDQLFMSIADAQSKEAYLAGIARFLRGASHFKCWAIGYQEFGLASVKDLTDLLKEFRKVKTIYSKDLTEVAGGLRNYVIIAERG